MLFPPVRRGPRRRERIMGAAFVAGAVGGALSTALVILLARGILSPIRGPVLTGIVLAIALVAIGLQASTGQCRFPQRHWQIPQDWVAGRHAAGARDFGFVLGMGYVTYVPSCAAHILLLALSVAPVSVVGLATAAAGFGVGRGAEVLAWSLLPRPGDPMREPGLRGVTFIARWVAPLAATSILVGGILL